MKYFESSQTDKNLAYLHCGAFLAALFKQTAAVLSDEKFVNLESEAEIAGQFRRYMVDGMITSHNVQRTQFFKNVTESAEAVSAAAKERGDSD